jgi:hypothetical protein
MRLAMRAPGQSKTLSHAERLEEIADIIAPLLDWSSKDRAESIRKYREILERERAEAKILLEPDTSLSS